MSPLSNLRIVIVAGTLAQGGAERQLYYILKALRAAGSEILLLCLTKGEFWQQPIEELGVTTIWVGQYSSPVLRLLKIIKTLAKFSPDLIQSQHFYANIYTALPGRILGIDHLGAIRSNLSAEIESNGVFGLWCLRLPRNFAVNSRAAIEKAIQLGVNPSKIFFLPNVIDCDVFSPTLKPEWPEFRLLSIGTLKKEKNFGLYLEVCARLQNHLSIQAVLVGDGPERIALEEKQRLLGLKPASFCFLGQSGNVLPYYQNTDVFVLTSLYEGTPNVVMEAMACGLPVVTTSVGGAADLIEHGVTGYLVKPGDHESDQFVHYLTILANDSELRTRLGDNARNCVLRKHNSKFLEKHLENVYRQVFQD